MNPLNFVSAEFKALAVAFYQFVLVNRFNSINNISSILKQRWIFLLVLAFLGSLYAIMLFFVFPVVSFFFAFY